MTLASVAIILAWVGVAITGLLVAVCWRDPVAGLKELHHHPEQLPEVMLGRYIGFFIMAIGVALLQSAATLCILGVGLTFMAFHDAWTYSKAGKPAIRHIIAGVAGTVITVVVALAWISNGAMA